MKNSPEKKAPHDHWNHYWTRGNLSSCEGAGALPLPQPLLDVWHAFFATLPDGATLLDIGTGNGVVPLIASTIAEQDQRRFSITATDAAERLQPPDGTGLPAGFGDVRFLPSTPTEALPFDDASFDAVTAQFAFEYGNPGSSLQQVARVLKPRGQALFVVHHPESSFATTARIELEHLAFIQHSALFQRAHDLLDHVIGRDHGTLAADPRAEALRSAFNRAAAAVNERATHSPAPEILYTALRYVLDVYRTHQEEGRERSFRRLSAAWQELLFARQRLLDQQHAAVGREELKRIQRLARLHGLHLEEQEKLLDERSRILGLRLLFSRTA